MRTSARRLRSSRRYLALRANANHEADRCAAACCLSLMPKQTRTIVLTVIATLFVVFVLQNLRSVSVRVIVWTPSVPLVGLLSLVFLAGGIAGWYWRRR